MCTLQRAETMLYEEVSSLVPKICSGNNLMLKITECTSLKDVQGWAAWHAQSLSIATVGTGKQLNVPFTTHGGFDTG